MLYGPDGELPEKLRNLEPRLIEHISNEIMDKDPNVRWIDIGNWKELQNYIINLNILSPRNAFLNIFTIIIIQLVWSTLKNVLQRW